jgi:hypothetical protein
MSDPANEPSCKPIHEPTKRMDLDAVLPNNLSSKKTQVDLIDCYLKFDKTCSAFRMVACEHQCLNGKCSTFRMIMYLDFNQFPQNSIKADSDFRDLQRQLFNNIISDSVFSDFQHQLFINIKANTFASLVCAPVTSTNQFNRDKSSATFKLVVASVSNNNVLSFDDKSSSTFKLVVVSVIIKFSNGPTNDSPAKQRPVSNVDPAIERSLQLHVPISLTFERSIKAFPFFQLMDVSVLDENDSCSVFQMVVYGHNTFIESTFFNDGSFQLVVESILISNSEGARFAPIIFSSIQVY